MEQVFFNVQLPHSYYTGSDIYPHIHWSPDGVNTDNVRWALAYEWMNIDTVYDSSTIIYVAHAGSGTSLMHQMASFSPISGIGKTMSSMLICRMFRDAANEADTFTGDAFLLEIDFHFQLSRLGSKYELHL